jgi:hypothetical protein
MTTPFGRLAHDLNNQLTIIQAYCTLLLKRFSRGEPCGDEAKEICRAAERARLVVRQIFFASYQPRPRGGVVDLNRVVNQVTETLRPFIGANVTLVTECRSAGPSSGPTRP